MARFRIRFRGPVSRHLVRWIEQLIPVLRDAPPEICVTVEIDAQQDEQTPTDAVESKDDKAPRRRENDPGHGPPGGT